MRVQRETTPHHLRLLREYLKRRPDGRRYRWLEYATYLGLATMAALALIGTVFARSPTMSFWWFAVSPVVGLLLWHPSWLLWDRRTGRSFVSANRAELGKQEFWIDERGFGNSTPAGSTFHVWTAVVSVEDTPEFGFVQATGHLYLIPKDVNEAEGSAFMTELLARWRSGEGAVEQEDAPVEARS